jgi:hypothetical protein
MRASFGQEMGDNGPLGGALTPSESEKSKSRGEFTPILTDHRTISDGNTIP